MFAFQFNIVAKWICPLNFKYRQKIGGTNNIEATSALEEVSPQKLLFTGPVEMLSKREQSNHGKSK